MMKKMFALASVTALTGLVATISAVGCSSTTTVADNTEGGSVIPSEGGPKKDSGGPTVDPDASDPDASTGKIEEKTVGKECTSTADCKVAGSVNDNQCAKGLFGSAMGGDDLFSSPVCIQNCTPNSNAKTLSDLFCDNDPADMSTLGPGVCLPTTSSGICLPACSFDSATVTGKCAGKNKCQYLLDLTDSAGKTSALGYCFGACTADADCRTGQKCQVEDGACVATLATPPYTAPGTACTRPAAGGNPTCNCNTVGNHADGGVSADKDKGICVHSCVTGAAGDAVCNGILATQKCTAKLPTLDAMNKPLYTAQPADISGTCALPCLTDATCATLAASSGLGALMKCRTFADGKFCDPSAD